MTIDDALYSEAKELAARGHSSVGSVIEDALRLLLREHKVKVALDLAPLPTHPGKLNLPPGIDENSTSQILSLLDELDFFERNSDSREHG